MNAVIEQPAGTPLHFFGANVAIACPCGQIIVAARGSTCRCKRKYSFFDPPTKARPDRQGYVKVHAAGPNKVERRIAVSPKLRTT